MLKIIVLLISLLVCTGTANSQGMLDWFNDLDHEQQTTRLAALEETKHLTFAATDDNFGKYLKRWLNRKGKNKSCYTGAYALMSELQADPTIGGEFDMKLYNTGVNLYGRSFPIPHFTIRMTPKNGIGPSYMADRYLGGVLAQILEWEEADLTVAVIEIYAKVYPVTDSDFDTMSDMLKPPPVIDPEPLCTDRQWRIIDALETGIPLPCESSSLFAGQPKYCPTHDRPAGIHCTIGSSKFCWVHRVPGMSHDITTFLTDECNHE